MQKISLCFRLEEMELPSGMGYVAAINTFHGHFLFPFFPPWAGEGKCLSLGFDCFGWGVDEQEVGEGDNLVRGSYVIISLIVICIVPHSLFYESFCLEIKERKYN